MKIEHLMTVLTVAKLRNFNEAAFELYCSQSSVSRHIRAVENELNITLFQRSSNSNVVQLTKQGEMLITQIGSIVDSYQVLEEMVKIPTQESKTQLRLGIGASIFSADMKSTLASKFYLAYPEIALRLQDVDKTHFLECLTLNKFDAILFYQPYWKDEPMEPPHYAAKANIMCIPIAKVKLRMGMGKNHALSAHRTVTVDMLSKEKFIFDTDTLVMADELPMNQHGMFMKMCRVNGFTPEIIRISGDLVNVKLFIAAQNECVYPSFMPLSLCTYRGIANVLVSDAPYYAQYYLLTVSGGGKTAVEKLAAFLQQTFQEASY